MITLVFDEFMVLPTLKQTVDCKQVHENVKKGPKLWLSHKFGTTWERTITFDEFFMLKILELGKWDVTL